MVKSIWKRKCVNNTNNNSNNNRCNNNRSNNNRTNQNDNMLALEFQGDVESAGTRDTGGLAATLTRMLSNSSN